MRRAFISNVMVAMLLGSAAVLAYVAASAQLVPTNGAPIWSGASR